MTDTMSTEHQIVASIRKIMRAVDLHSRRLVEAHGLTGPQLATLQEAARLGPVPAIALSRAVHLSQATVTGILNRLQRDGLVERHRSDTDRRSVLITVTDAGRRALSAAPSLLQDRFRASLQGLEHWERLQILSTLQRVASLMGAEELDASPHLVSGSVAEPAGTTGTPGAASASGGDAEHPSPTGAAI